MANLEWPGAASRFLLGHRPLPTGSLCLGLCVEAFRILPAFRWRCFGRSRSFDVIVVGLEGSAHVGWRLIVSLQVLLLPTAMAFMGGGEDLRGGSGPPFGFASHTNYAMQIQPPRLGGTPDSDAHHADSAPEEGNARAGLSGRNAGWRDDGALHFLQD